MASDKKNFLINPWLLCFLFQSCIATTDVITANQGVPDGMLLVSDGGIFALGFFSPGTSTKRYLGIWYYMYDGKSLQEKVVWVANRETPIEDSSGKLVIKNGNLLVMGGNQNFPIWSTNVSSGSRSFAKILDSGNLVLFQGQKIVWQSFDYLTHVWLPGMKLGVDIRKGFNRSLVSWKSPNDPAPGKFNLMLDATILAQFYLLKDLNPYWRSEPWGNQGLTGVPDLPKSPFNFTFVNNPNEVYLIYNPQNASILHYYSLNEVGMLQRFSWLERNHQWNKFWSVPKDQCDSYNQCGSFGKCNSNDALDCSCLPGFKPQFPQEWNIRDASAGCLRKREIECGKDDGGFLKLQHVKIPDTLIGEVIPGLSLDECRKICMENCSCSAYTVSIWNSMGKSCVVWYEDLLDTRQYTGGGDDLYLRVDAIEIENAKKKSGLFGGDKRIQYAVFIPCLAIVFGIVICIIIFVKRTRSRDNEDKLSELLVLNDYLTHNHLRKAAQHTELPIFDLDLVMAATENFSETNKLGEGGFGPVYRGKFSAEHDVAVKRMSKNSGQGIEEFKNEVLLMAKLQHRNLVRLLGCCIQGEEKMLIYEYMPNGSLDSFIFDDAKRVLLDWKTRYNIIVGIARGILYLHQDARFKIIHRDLKASNVLLDLEKNPKISDFGAARIFGAGTQSKIRTNRVIGTYGYMSPEYATSGFFSVKSDVYSFGVLLLEIVSGKRNISYYHDDPTSNVIGFAYELWKAGKSLELVDTLMEEQYCIDEVQKCIHVGLLCVQRMSKDRPTMASVVFMLGTNSNTLPPPNPPAYVVVDHPQTHTLACVTTTIVQAR